MLNKLTAENKKIFIRHAFVNLPLGFALGILGLIMLSWFVEVKVSLGKAIFVVSGPAGICIYLAWNDYRTLLAQQKSRKDEKDTGGKTGSGNSNKVL